MPRARTGLRAILAAVLAFGATQALAHARLVRSAPAANATVSSPKLIHLQFSETLAARFSNFRLTAADGHAVALAARAAGDEQALEAVVHAPLAPGVYTVSWTAVASDDGHRTSGQFRFTVR